MALETIWAKVGKWRIGQAGKNKIKVDQYEPLRCQAELNEVVVKDPVGVERRQSGELVNEGFNRLVEQLESINDNLSKQSARHEALMDRIDKLPDMLSSVPEAAQSQMEVAQALVEQLKEKSYKEQQFIEAIEKIPAETKKHTNMLSEMSHKLSVSAEVGSQMSDTFNRFNDNINSLNTETTAQTQGLAQMNKTFAASDRYLKYLVTRQNKRMIWMFIVTAGVCVFSIIMAVLCFIAVLKA